LEEGKDERDDGPGFHHSSSGSTATAITRFRKTKKKKTRRELASFGAWVSSR
jgi:hypothetical protein